MKFITSSTADSKTTYWADKLKTSFGLDSELKSDVTDGYILLRLCYKYLSVMPESLVRACKVTKLIFKYLGENRPLYPNHGSFNPADGTVVMNTDMFYHPDEPDDFTDSRGYTISRVAQTLYHEFAHALDQALGNISLQDPWLKLSGWSKDREPGLKRLIINEPGAPKIVGEWWYSADSKKFTRFYAMRNPYDDLADSIAFWLSNLKDKVPDNKREYLDKLLSPYYKK